MAEKGAPEMKTYLHFIGRSHYPTIAAFEDEARQIGITRVASLSCLKAMSYGDRVVLAMWLQPSKGKPYAAIFGEFIISTISGISAQTLDAFKHVYPWQVVNFGGQHVERGCGDYVTGETVAFLGEAPELGEVAQAAKALKTGDKPMVGGRYVAHPQRTRMKNLPHSMGFREFNYYGWQMAVAGGVPRGGVVGCFYTDVKEDLGNGNVVDFGQKQAQVVLGYQGKGA